MTLNNSAASSNEGEIHSKTLIDIDEDVSLEKLNFLVKLSIEEERLDYKEKLDFSDKPKSKKSKIDIAADLVAISNTDGGYLIVGVKEQDAGQFSVEGVDEECINQLTQENIHNFLGNYIESIPKIIVRCHQVDDRKLIIIFISKAKTLIPFKQDGQYGDNQRKFNSGDIFVRHGSKTSKANFEDLRKLIDNIRLDERKQINVDGKGTAQIVSRLDKLIEVMSGTKSNFNDLNVQDSSFEAIEDYFFGLARDDRNIPTVKRAVSNHFQKIKLAMQELEKIPAGSEGLLEKINLATAPMIEKVIPIWSALNEAENDRMLLKVSHSLYDLWLYTFNFFGNQNENEHIKLVVHAEIVKVAYVCIALSIKEQRVAAAKSLVKRPAHVAHGEHADAYWFRYVLTWLARTKQLKVASLVRITNESFKDNAFVKSKFNSNEEFLKFLAQADFVQCMSSKADVGEGNFGGCWPSFRLHKKIFVMPILEDIIDHDNDKWIDTVTNERLLEIWTQLEEFQQPEMQRNWNWDSDYRGSKKLETLINKVKGNR